VISNVSLQVELIFLQNNNHVDDLFSDLCDGRLLICLLETISGEKLGKIGMDLLGKYTVDLSLLTR